MTKTYLLEPEDPQKYLPHLYMCSSCGGAITEEQILLALEDALLGFSEQEQDSLTLCCSDYTEEHGCQGGNEGLPYWYTN